MQLKRYPSYKMTLKDHVELGQAIKDVKSSVLKVLDLVDKFDICRAKDRDRIQYYSCMGVLSELQCEADDLMFKDYPELDSRAYSVYYHENEKITPEDLV